MSYEGAPATKLLATHCICCGHALVDAVSVEAGVGPDCREKYGYGNAQGPADWATVMSVLGAAHGTAVAFDPVAPPPTEHAARSTANCLTARIAAEPRGAKVGAFLTAIRALGFSKLADQLEARLVRITIVARFVHLEVTSPYSPHAVELFRGVPGRRWDPDRKVNTFPASSRRQLHQALQAAYPGTLAAGPKGTFRIASEDELEDAAVRAEAACPATVRSSASFAVQAHQRSRAAEVARQIAADEARRSHAAEVVFSIVAADPSSEPGQDADELAERRAS